MFLKSNENDEFFENIINTQAAEEKQKCLKLNRQTAEELLSSLHKGFSQFQENFNLTALYGSSNNTILHCIAESPQKNSDLLKIINPAIKSGVDINAFNIYNTTALYLSVLNHCFNKNINLISSLLEEGADPNIKCSDGNTALHIAANLRALDVSRLLLSFGADPKMTNHAGLTAREFMMTRRDVSGQDIKDFDNVLESIIQFQTNKINLNNSVNKINLNNPNIDKNALITQSGLSK